MIYPLNQPLTELLLLSTISKNDSYGYVISQNLKRVSNLKDSALYPMLKRLSDQNLVEIYDQLYQGRNRKYYKITPTGEQYRKQLMDEWNQYCYEIGVIVHHDDNMVPVEKISNADIQIENTNVSAEAQKGIGSEGSANSDVVVEGGKEND